MKDCCKIADGTILPPDTVVPPFTFFAGVPGRMVEELPECARDLHRDLARCVPYHAHARPSLHRHTCCAVCTLPCPCQTLPSQTHMLRGVYPPMPTPDLPFTAPLSYPCFSANSAISTSTLCLDPCLQPRPDENVLADGARVIAERWLLFIGVVAGRRGLKESRLIY